MVPRARVLSRVLWAVAVVSVTAVAVFACGTSGTKKKDDLVLLPDPLVREAGEDSGELILVDAADAGDSAASSVLCNEPDLVMCFTFEGVVKDLSKNALTPSVLKGATFLPGKSGDAVVLTSTSLIQFALNPVFHTPKATVEAWIRPAQITTPMVLFDADNRHAMIMSSDGALYCGSATVIVRAGPLNAGVWMHAACVFDGATIRAYLDGIEKGSTPGSPTPVTDGGAGIGNDTPSGAFPWMGAIDSLRVFSSARTPQQIAAASKP